MAQTHESSGRTTLLGLDDDDEVLDAAVWIVGSAVMAVKNGDCMVGIF